MASGELGRAVARVLADLSSTERTAFVLRHFEGYSKVEIGRLLGIRNRGAARGLAGDASTLRGPESGAGYGGRALHPAPTPGLRFQGLARSEQDPDLRGKAIEGLGLIGREKSAGALRALWESETDPEVKKAIVEAFFLQNNTQALIDIVRSEQDKELRSEALEYLSLIGSDETVDFLLEALEK